MRDIDLKALDARPLCVEFEKESKKMTKANKLLLWTAAAWMAAFIAAALWGYYLLAPTL
jgi:hypothetical protein